ncbi:LEAF RUST 10 DISEASE-RESISTANCE LOCUS RECEPTOR-LIKE PROTEIN KINASE-like 2.1 [Senna tora]|uniref:non-specific serine/threonine protein kinase n=1 Tax=Senna tora TaxID=362788 RepID=A0A834W6M5_9FABA|nr:LEAF RUST 10 DISEASE-RESISTANCE LOCUS RECEPTOR-LIKE PROTEIN KINASE-like 2.1 [Senna tora]
MIIFGILLSHSRWKSGRPQYSALFSPQNGYLRFEIFPQLKALTQFSNRSSSTPRDVGILIEMKKMTKRIDMEDGIRGEDYQFTNCSEGFRCGNFISNLKYPFWGGNRAEYCGLPDFELICEENINPVLIIHSIPYRILDFDSTSQSLRMARDDFNSLCPIIYKNNTFDPTTFNYDNDVLVNLTFLYNCSTNLSLPYQSFRIMCSEAGDTDTFKYAYYALQTQSVVNTVSNCNSIIIPIFKSRASDSMFQDTIEEALNEGFGVKLRVKNEECNTCGRSGGECGYNKTEGHFSCFCKDGPHTYSCSQESTGQGGYGVVYKASLPDARLAAVKVLSESKGSHEEFINEVWKALFQIVIGIARGLEYLHQGCNTRILHFDIKPQNILLDEDFCPKISDFGLSKICKKKESIVSIMGTRGTAGFIAPEVFSRVFGRVSHKSDVFSYGMLVLEMVGGRKNYDSGGSHTDEMYFSEWIYKDLEEGNILGGSMSITKEENEVIRKMTLVSLWCIQTNPSNRPAMSKVVEMLEGSVLSLQIPPKPSLHSPTLAPLHLSNGSSNDMVETNSISTKRML